MHLKFEKIKGSKTRRGLQLQIERYFFR